MLDCIVIGAGQAGLAVGYYLRKKGLDFVLLDAESGPGAAWRHTWPSLTLFSNAASSNPVSYTHLTLPTIYSV